MPSFDRDDVEAMCEDLGEPCLVGGKRMFGVFSNGSQDVEIDVGNFRRRLESNNPTLTVPSHKVAGVAEGVDVTVDDDEMNTLIRGEVIVYTLQAARHDGEGFCELELSEKSTDAS